jgi:hypothetical protein
VMILYLDCELSDDSIRYLDTECVIILCLYSNWTLVFVWMLTCRTACSPDFDWLPFIWMILLALDLFLVLINLQLESLH